MTEPLPQRDARLLLLDTCGDPATLALAEGERIAWETATPGRSASAQILPLLSEGMESLGWTPADLHGIGVVHGPGSFTGMRVGLAIAKGLCLAAGKPLGLASRLAVMLDEEPEKACTAVLSAGRGELYALRPGSGEALMAMESLPGFAAGTTVLFAEEGVQASLATLKELSLRRCRADAASALPLLREALQAGGTPVSLADAHYVRAPEQTFKRPALRNPEPMGV